MIYIHRMVPCNLGILIRGSFGEFYFDTLVDDLADNPEWNLFGSRITQLHIVYNYRTVFNWDRAMIVDAGSEEVEDLVVRLCTELHKVPYKPGDRVTLLALSDPGSVPIGSLGTVTWFQNKREWFDVGVDWDCGEWLMLKVPPDRVAFEPPATDNTSRASEG